MICIPIRKKLKLLDRFIVAQKKADLTELWFDEMSLSEKEINQIFKAKIKPIIYKCQKPENISRYLNFLVDYIDIDIETPIKFIKYIKNNNPKIQIIISKHNFNETPSNAIIKSFVKKIKAKGADIIKIATTAKQFSDSLRMMSILNEISKGGEKVIFICMEKEGKITRLAGHLLGNYLMFAPLTQAEKTASGQLSFDELQKIIKLTK